METLKIATGLMAFLALGFMVGFIFGHSVLWREKLSPLFSKIVDEFYDLCNENNNDYATCNKNCACFKAETESQNNDKDNCNNVFEKSFNCQSIKSNKRGKCRINEFCCHKGKKNHCICCKCNCALGKYRKIEKRDIEKIIEKIVTGK